MTNVPSDEVLQLKALLEKRPLELSNLELLDEPNLEFLHATVSQDNEEMRQRIIEATAEYVPNRL